MKNKLLRFIEKITKRKIYITDNSIVMAGKEVKPYIVFPKHLSKSNSRDWFDYEDVSNIKFCTFVCKSPSQSSDIILVVDRGKEQTHLKLNFDELSKLYLWMDNQKSFNRIKMPIITEKSSRNKIRLGLVEELKDIQVKKEIL